jgi:cysteine desulfurase
MCSINRLLILLSLIFALYSVAMSLIYLDYNSTTPVDPIVLEAMLPWFTERFGNASSHSHLPGFEAKAAVELARQQTADAIGCEPSEIVFTSGATEAINIAIRGTFKAYSADGKHIISVKTEHKAVLDTLEDLKSEGAEITLLDVDREGRIDLEALKNAVRKETIMVCVMLANNETGTLQDTEAIGRICEEKKIAFFSDTTQSFGKIRVNVKDHRFSLACISAHKFYGPKGVGALYVSRKNPRAVVSPVFTGGGQENGLRSGTYNVPGIVGLGAAIKLANEGLWDYAINTSRLRTIVEQYLELYCKSRINGSMKDRLPNTCNILIPGIKSERLIKHLTDVGISTGSACTSAIAEPSHVLKAMGLTNEEAEASIRVSIGKNNTQEEILEACKAIEEAVKVC